MAPESDGGPGEARLFGPIFRDVPSYTGTLRDTTIMSKTGARNHRIPHYRDPISTVKISTLFGCSALTSS